MSKLLFIGEKPNAIKPLISFFEAKTGQKARSEEGTIKVGDYYFTAASGFLLGLCDIKDYLQSETPQSWELMYQNKTVPFIPSPFKKKLNEGAAKRLKEIKSALSKVDKVVHFGDPDDAGQLIVDEILTHCHNRKPVLRFWTGALNNDSLEKAFKNMQDNELFQGMRWYAQARSYADWLFGINLTVTATVDISRQARALQLGATPLTSIGRVQSPTLGLVVRRALEIENFVPIEHYQPNLKVYRKAPFDMRWVAHNFGLPVSNADDLLLSKEVAEKIIQTAQQGVEVIEVNSTEHTESPPLPFDLGSLQMHMNRCAGFTADKTLKIAQILYDQKKVLYYPRTDWAHLPTELHGQAPAVFKTVGHDLPQLANAIKNANFTLRSKAFNDKKIGSHHGIVPTGEPAKNLTDEEALLYQEVCKRYLLQFFPEAKYVQLEIKAVGKNRTQVNGVVPVFKATGRQYLNRGWRSAFNTEEPEETKSPMLPSVQKGEILEVLAADVGQSKTTPPAYYTEATLISAMLDAWKYVKSPEVAKRLKGNLDNGLSKVNGESVPIQAGIGTQATRAEIIETLKHRGVVTVVKGKFYPTPLGRLLYSVIPEQLKWPDETAIWQMELDRIRVAPAQAEAACMDFTRRMGEAVKVLAQESQKNAQALTRKDFEGIEFRTYGSNGGKQSTAPHPKGAKMGARKSSTATKARSVTKTAPEKKSSPNSIKSSNMSYTCPRCKKGHLVLRATKADPTKKFWGCSDFVNGCRVFIEDANGKPKL